VLVRAALAAGTRVIERALIAGALVAAAGCGSKPAVEPLVLDGNLLTVSNGTGEEWRDVEIRLNRQFRVTTPSILPGQRVQAPLDTFVAGYGQRFNFKRMQIADLRLTAKRPNGQPIELVKQFDRGGLADALRGFGGER
jgi:hypothetical protein